MPAAFSTNWAVTRKRECASGVEFLLAKMKFCPTHFLSLATQPNTNQMPSGICTAKRRLWVDGVVQLYIRFEKASPPRNGVRLHLTFLRLAPLVGIGHEGLGEGAEGECGRPGPFPGSQSRVGINFTRIGKQHGKLFIGGAMVICRSKGFRRESDYFK